MQKGDSPIPAAGMVNSRKRAEGLPGAGQGINVPEALIGLWGANVPTCRSDVVF
jgi:hypothetical protein